MDNAKKLGYAESNPTSDLNGDDVAAKLKILSSLCFNSFINHNIYVEGIKEIDKVAFIRFASVYREFQDIGEFQAQIDDLKD